MKKMRTVGICLGVVGLMVILASLMVSSLGNSIEDISPADTLDENSSRLGPQESVKNIVLNADLQKSPERIMVFRKAHNDVTKEDAIKFAKKFNITDISDPKDGEDVISISSKDMRYRIILYKNGGALYEDSLRVDTPNELDVPENLPSDAEAERIATKFLKERNLFPDNATFAKSIHDMSYKLNRSGGDPIVIRENIELGYTRQLNGFPVEGTQFMIGVGAHGDIISFFSNWKEYTPTGEKPVKSPATAFEDLKRKGISARAGAKPIDTVSINQTYLAYYTKAVAYDEEYLEPVWVFKGTALKNGNSVTSIEEFIPALTEDPF